jgi:hypothetical protein
VSHFGHNVKGKKPIERWRWTIPPGYALHSVICAAEEKFTFALDS